jgi:type VI secretion system protein ImpH
MESAKRGQGSAVTRHLSEQPYSFSFFQSVFLLERLCAEKKPLGVALSPKDEPVKFRVRPGFAFPASEISALRFFETESRAEMDVTFMGLIGPSGVLPHWYNELCLERVKNKDSSLVDFLDMFHHRLISLFYLAWKRSRITVNFQSGGNDRFSARLRSLIGLGSGSGTLPQGIRAESLLYFSGLIARRSPSVSAIESAVSHFAGQKAVIHQFVERAIELPRSERTSIGRANSALGENVVCGSLVWENTSKFRIDLGPMGSAEFSKFLPGKELLRSIFSLVRFIVGIEYEFDLRLILKRDQVAPCMLGGSRSGFAPLLGWSTWLTGPGTILEKDPQVIFQEAETIAVGVA